MIVAITSCPAYADAQEPFLRLFKHFWPDCPYEIFAWGWNQEIEWAPMVAMHAKAQAVNYPYSPILLMQDDFFFTTAVNSNSIRAGLAVYRAMDAACVRLYPCPGAEDDDSMNDFGIIPKGDHYRISCQAAIWNPGFLATIANNCGRTASDFEINGTELALDISETVYAWKRSRQPWPMQYLCSAISRGRWNPAAINLCKSIGYELDTSHREIAPA